MDIGITFSDNFLGSTGPVCDLSLTSGDLTKDSSLLTPTIISLFSDRLAATDDVIPDGSSNRRGWWGDTPLDPNNTGPIQSYLGSKLWLLTRAKQNADTLSRAISYCKDALKWLVDAGVVAAVDVTGQWGTTGTALGQLLLTITVSKVSSSGATIKTKYDLVWNATFPS